MAVALIARERKSLVILQIKYRQYLSSRWKLITIAAAALSMTGMAPYTVDPTWDYVDAKCMSILTFLLA